MMHRTIAAAAFFAAAAIAAPPLTTIQDVLYKADGTRFNGLVIISWTSFEAPDTSNIATQSTTVKVTDGNLRVQLVPTTTSMPSAYYLVKYNSDGRVQFNETWAVPSSTRPLRVRDVRIANNAVAQPDTVGLAGPIQESDVIGLAADLGARPFKSAAYTSGRAVYVNAQGALETVSGSPADCVRVDGSAGPCGAFDSAFADADTPAGIVDGSNVSFSLAGVPNPPASLALFRNGMLLKAGQDFTASSRTITFVAEMTPQPGDTLLANYRLASAGGAPQVYPLAQVLCSGTGAATASTTETTLATCSIPASLLTAGDRVEIRYDLEHQGTAQGFHFALRWGGSTIVQRNAAAGDALLTGRVDAAVRSSGVQVSSQSWGTVLPFSAGVATAGDDLSGGIAVEFLGNTTDSGADTVTLKNFTVIRFP